MAEIAAQVGVVEGAIYKYFGSKRELLFATTRDFYEPVIAATKENLAGISGTRDRLRCVITRLLRSFVEHPGLCRVIIQEIRTQDDYYRTVVRELNREWTSLVLSILEQGTQAGDVRRDVRPTLVRDVIFGGAEHVAWKTLAGRGTLDVEAQANSLTELILGGIEARHTDSRTNESVLDRLRVQVDRLEALLSEFAAPAAPRPQTKATRRR